MSPFDVVIIAAAASLSLMLVGGALYEFLVVDPFWPRRPDIVQPGRGGISRKRFWIPAHTLYELLLISALVLARSLPEVQFWLWIALASHGVMRIWSAFDFVPKALAFERADPDTISESAARRWSFRSRFRLPLDLVACGAMLAAFANAVQS